MPKFVGAYETFHLIGEVCIDEDEAVVEDDLECALLTFKIGPFHNIDVEGFCKFKGVVAFEFPNQTARQG